MFNFSFFKFFIKIIIIISFFASTSLLALELPKVDKFSIKEVKDKNILYTVHTEEEGHITNSLIKLIQYYLLKESNQYKVVFPQLSIESNSFEGTYFGIGYQGNPKETKEIKTLTLKGGTFASYVYQGSYKYISKGIRKTFKKILETNEYIPHNDEEIRLLYWNSIDDNYPKELITEIQVRIVKK